MKIIKGTFKLRQGVDEMRIWHEIEGSYGNDFPFYAHRGEGKKLWTLSHMPTGYAIKKGLTLKQARRLSTALKDYAIFLMPTVETLQHQKSLLSSRKQTLLLNLIHNSGEPNEQ